MEEIVKQNLFQIKDESYWKNKYEKSSGIKYDQKPDWLSGSSWENIYLDFVITESRSSLEEKYEMLSKTLYNNKSHIIIANDNLSNTDIENMSTIVYLNDLSDVDKLNFGKYMVYDNTQIMWERQSPKLSRSPPSKINGNDFSVIKDYPIRYFEFTYDRQDQMYVPFYTKYFTEYNLADSDYEYISFSYNENIYYIVNEFQDPSFDTYFNEDYLLYLRIGELYEPKIFDNLPNQINVNNTMFL